MSQTHKVIWKKVKQKLLKLKSDKKDNKERQSRNCNNATYLSLSSTLPRRHPSSTQNRPSILCDVSPRHQVRTYCFHAPVRRAASDGGLIDEEEDAEPAPLRPAAVLPVKRVILRPCNRCQGQARQQPVTHRPECPIAQQQQQQQRTYEYRLVCHRPAHNDYSHVNLLCPARRLQATNQPQQQHRTLLVDANDNLAAFDGNGNCPSSASPDCDVTDGYQSFEACRPAEPDNATGLTTAEDNGFVPPDLGLVSPEVGFAETGLNPTGVSAPEEEFIFLANKDLRGGTAAPPSTPGEQQPPEMEEDPGYATLDDVKEQVGSKSRQDSDDSGESPDSGSHSGPHSLASDDVRGGTVQSKIPPAVPPKPPRASRHKASLPSAPLCSTSDVVDMYLTDAQQKPEVEGASSESRTRLRVNVAARGSVDSGFDCASLTPSPSPKGINATTAPHRLQSIPSDTGVRSPYDTLPENDIFPDPPEASALELPDIYAQPHLDRQVTPEPPPPEPHSLDSTPTPDDTIEGNIDRSTPLPAPPEYHSAHVNSVGSETYAIVPKIGSRCSSQTPHSTPTPLEMAKSTTDDSRVSSRGTPDSHTVSDSAQELNSINNMQYSGDSVELRKEQMNAMRHNQHCDITVRHVRTTSDSDGSERSGGATGGCLLNGHARAAVAMDETYMENKRRYEKTLIKPQPIKPENQDGRDYIEGIVLTSLAGTVHHVGESATDSDLEGDTEPPPPVPSRNYRDSKDARNKGVVSNISVQMEPSLEVNEPIHMTMQEVLQDAKDRGIPLATPDAPRGGRRTSSSTLELRGACADAHPRSQSVVSLETRGQLGRHASFTSVDCHERPPLTRRSISQQRSSMTASYTAAEDQGHEPRLPTPKSKRKSVLRSKLNTLFGKGSSSSSKETPAKTSQSVTYSPRSKRRGLSGQAASNSSATSVRPRGPQYAASVCNGSMSAQCHGVMQKRSLPSIPVPDSSPLHEPLMSTTPLPYPDVMTSSRHSYLTDTSPPDLMTMSLTNSTMMSSMTSSMMSAGDLDVPDGLFNGQEKDFLSSLEKLKDCGWYWGPLSWDDAESKLSSQRDGSFLVRDSSDDRYILSLSFRSQGATHHTRIEHYKGMFSFYSQPKSHGAATIVDFIEKAMQHSSSGKFLYFLRPRAPGLPPAPVQLLYPISRFRAMRSLQHMCRFRILKMVRHDHIDFLPLPPRMKFYLKERQYYTEYMPDDLPAAPQP